jgi:predicted nucleic acid-binding protein
VADVWFSVGSPARAQRRPRRRPLVDPWALARLAPSTEAATWTERMERGLVRISTVTRLEIGYSARSGPELRTGCTARP